ncbi:hypothetical protein FRC12_021900 [Ceratobasidium sp. 428]|nr:hypothetical protein FRC12_021900 [Ceratobasidium sp. 428]
MNYEGKHFASVLDATSAPKRQRIYFAHVQYSPRIAPFDTHDHISGLVFRLGQYALVAQFLEHLGRISKKSCPRLIWASRRSSNVQTSPGSNRRLNINRSTAMHPLQRLITSPSAWVSALAVRWRIPPRVRLSRRSRLLPPASAALYVFEAAPLYIAFMYPPAFFS